MENIFSFDNMYSAYKKCCNGVRWKTSTKNYIAKSIPTISKTINQLKDETYKIGKPYKFTLKERGKVREIEALHIKDRVVQRCFCDNYFIGLLRKYLIYDSGACLDGKGTKFTINRLKAHLQKYRRKGGTNKGYVLLIDYSKFFNSINHEKLLKMVKPLFNNEKIFNLYSQFIKNDLGCGLSLGSQVSQISALLYVSKIDKYIKEKMGIKYYGRYMDDAYLIHTDKGFLQKCLNKIIELSNELGLKINLKKTRICRIDKGFVFLNRHWELTETGYIKIKPTRKSIYRLRRRARKIIKKSSREVMISFIASLNGYFKQFKGRITNYVFNKIKSDINYKWQNC